MNLFKVCKFAYQLMQRESSVIPLNLHLTDVEIYVPKNFFKKVSLYLQLCILIKKATNTSNNHLTKFFDSNFYKKYYADLSNLNLSSWVHYYNFGKLEGRRTSPLFEFEYIINQIEELELNHSSNLAQIIKQNNILNISKYVDLSLMVNSDQDKILKAFSPQVSIKVLAKQCVYWNLLEFDKDTFKDDEKLQTIFDSLKSYTSQKLSN